MNKENMGHDMNVTGVWSQGITGKNVVVAILDDGLDMNHKDLEDNYVSKLDFVSITPKINVFF